ncbi:glycoside hydrolase family 43 protein [Flavisphingomonas formosensis]|uniref:glycoside hydrolase family 43 protein n=1 Tax=Flavisphingomonas formosensis TaxID=861534 RepID=UPI0012FB64CD|nr:glycoside hydrolase family 43 protein [Sphingomonas formosensis]
MNAGALLIGLSGLALLAVPSVGVAGNARYEDFRYDGRSMETVQLKAGQFRNPILSGYYPDPSITRVGDDFYLVNSSFSHFPGLPVFHSRDLVSWVQIGNAIDRPSQLNLGGRAVSDGAFAPDISWHNGLFYIVNTCVRCGENFVITASNPAGPWSDPIWLPFEGIDPSIYWEGDRAFIVNNRAPAEPPRYDGHRAIWIQEFDWRAGKMVGESTQIVNGGVDIRRKPIWIEGPHIFKKDGYYYLIAAEGGTSDNHSEVVFRSASLRGPYLPYAGNPILTQRDLDPARPDPVAAAGHAKFVQLPNGDWWATFLATRPYRAGLFNVGRETFLLPVSWRDGWPQILPQRTAIPFAAARPALPVQSPPPLPTSGDFSYIDNFEEGRLGPQWIGIRTPLTPFYRLDGGALVLSHGAALGDRTGVPAFIGRRQQHHIATISTTMRFTPDRDGERAGLAAVQSDDSFLFFGIVRIDGKAMIALCARDKAQADRLVAAAPVRVGKPVTLTIRVSGGRMGFDYAVGKERHNLLQNFDASFLSTTRAGGFVGTVIGPYAAMS